MGLRFRSVRLPAIVLAFALGVPFPAASWAQKHGGVEWAHPPAELPPVKHGDRANNLDKLFAALKAAPDKAAAKAIEDRIWAVWMISGSDTCNLLMGRVKVAVAVKHYDVALRLLNAVIELKPDYVEAWNERATVYYLKNDYGHAITDIAQVLAREPRQFGALSGLGMILQQLGDDKDALNAYRRALAIDPHLEHIPDTVRELSEKVDGSPI